MGITTIIGTLSAVLPYTPTYFVDISERNNSLVTVIFPAINTWAGEANALAITINENAILASTSAASAIESARIADANANFKGTWSSATSYALPSSVYYNGEFFIALQAGSNQTPNPLAATAYWVPYSIAFQITNATLKATPLDADIFGLVDSISGILQKLTLSDIKKQTRIGKNLLINTDFGGSGSGNYINQRGYAGIATTISNQYTIDRWRVVTLGESLVWVGASYQFVAPAGGVEQIIKNSSIIGGSYVLSFVGTAVATVYQSNDYTNVTTLIAPANGVYTVSAGNYVKVRFAGGTFGYPKFEAGTVPTTYDTDGKEAELSMCKPYYQKLSLTSVGQATTTTGAGGFTLTAPVLTIKQAVVTVPSAGGFTLSGASGTLYTCTAVTYVDTNETHTSGLLKFTAAIGTANLVVGNSTVLRGTVSGLVTLDAEF